jgi:hypothetical protein
MTPEPTVDIQQGNGSLTSKIMVNSDVVYPNLGTSVY